MTSFIAAGGSGRSTSFIPAVPAAWSVTTIAFIVRLPVSSPRLHGCRSTPCPRTGYPTETDRSGSWPRPPRCEMRNGRTTSVSSKLSPRSFVSLLEMLQGWKARSTAVYLDVEPAVPGRDVDENPRGRVLREVPPIVSLRCRQHRDGSGAVGALLHALQR